MRLGVAAAVMDGALVRGDVEVDAGVVAAAGLGGNGTGLAIPGLVDLQVNGYAGVDILAAEPGELVALGRALAREGVLAYQPTLVTTEPDELRSALTTVGQSLALPGPASIIGAHLEGPFLSPARAGAHPRALLRAPNLDLLASFLVSGCPVTMVTLAPELDGADELIEALVERRIAVSIGHTDAAAATAHAAFDLGARSVTHLFNAMPPLASRAPGPVGVAYARDDVTVMLIADGAHVAPDSIRATWRAARGRLALVSDAIAAAGMGDGEFALGPVRVEVRDGVSRLPDGTLAGGVRSLAWGLRFLIELGVPIVEAVDAVTRVPAALVRRPDLGRLAVGLPADLVVLDDAFAVRAVLAGGVAVT